MWKQIQKRLQSPDSFVSLILGVAVVLVVGTLIYNYFTNRAGQTAKEQEQQKQGQISLPTTHTVAQGETLWMIAEKYYGSGYNWSDVAGANNLSSADDIEVGQTLTIPVATPMITQTETQAPTPTMGAIGSTATETPAATAKTYTVVRGDSLWNIAVAQYGDGYKWVEIAKANNLANPNLIHAGNVFVLP
ncbi:hypothetical protein A2875_00085 [Candidatus Gottesmanbacteria bacterium RIFCSPHIGHO2_01_FULL_46_14]|uniref:LysM domain-containing protein n=3 Tax=Microgenomates group TaxID=1794810 RepID=A0A1F5ZKS9_9BACT|nr:MAG: LysM domain protein [Candidatus Curtissbacteria bacterium GW2011_GWA1_41_11]OGG13090.1 MAG: hypothetical protein A2875_00085 [Candidatus Gottesmanbacteria bacterium RIFCSPHIGHO2_01_FULL_46_14]OGG29008.1 MAG: hypothetical protein A2971_03225 [Candidatus Gottesmanbacteria bacterium RIFCSPLOWO2_01_FULL_46_21]HCR92384.1 hypothetical protein [Candidatus Paceibacterota bacterium]